MLSRVADSVYWMNRYVERAENVARFIDVNHNLTLGDGSGLDDQWAPLIYITGDQVEFEQLYGDYGRDNILRFLVFDDRNPNSILSCVAKARENARTVREVISLSMWEQLNKFYLLMRAAAAQPAEALRSPYEFCEQVKLASHTLVGVTYSTMSHGEAWHFGRLGRLIERADKTSRIVDVQYFVLLPTAQDVGTSLDVVRWSALLKSATALEMYRREHGRIVPENVANFLLLNRYFPRSVHFCLIHSQESLREISGSHRDTFRNRSEQILGRLRADLDYTRIEDVVKHGIHEFIDDLQQRLNDLGAAIRDDFFTTSRQEQSGGGMRQIQ